MAVASLAYLTSLNIIFTFKFYNLKFLYLFLILLFSNFFCEALRKEWDSILSLPYVFIFMKKIDNKWLFGFLM